MSESPDLNVSVCRQGDLTIWRREGVPLDRILAALNDEGETLKASHKSVTRRVGGWVVKTSGHEIGLGMLKRTFRRARYRRAWESALHLARHGVGVPLPHAYVERGRLGIVTGNAFICEYLADSCDVEARADRLIADGGSDERIHAYLGRVADAVNALVESGAYHADLAGKNILTREGDAFWFIDLDSVTLRRRYTDALRMKNHVQLYDSFLDQWDDAFLEPFIARMMPDTVGLAAWMEQVRALQATRRARTEAAWRRQGRL